MERVLLSYLEHICGKTNVHENYPLKSLTTFGIGGNARFFVAVNSKDKLQRLISALKFIEQKYFIIGNGSNILAHDDGYNGVVIKLGFDEIIDNACFIYADAGVKIGKLCNFAYERGLSGLEFAYGIPATVGGAVYMNAGAFGGAISDVVVMVDALVDSEIKTIEAKNLKFDYRKSVFQKKDWIVLGAYFYLKPCDKNQIRDRMTTNLEKRRTTQPQAKSAGSVFKRDKNLIVSRAIDELGLKGTRIGDAEISTKHAGFIINTGSATSRDVTRLISLIRKQIKSAHNVTLKTEIQILK